MDDHDEDPGYIDGDSDFLKELAAIDQTMGEDRRASMFDPCFCKKPSDCPLGRYDNGKCTAEDLRHALGVLMKANPYLRLS